LVLAQKTLLIIGEVDLTAPEKEKTKGDSGIKGKKEKGERGKMGEGSLSTYASRQMNEWVSMEKKGVRKSVSLKKGEKDGKKKR